MSRREASTPRSLSQIVGETSKQRDAAELAGQGVQWTRIKHCNTEQSVTLLQQDLESLVGCSLQSQRLHGLTCVPTVAVVQLDAARPEASPALTVKVCTVCCTGPNRSTIAALAGVRSLRPLQKAPLLQEGIKSQQGRGIPGPRKGSLQYRSRADLAVQTGL